MVRQPGTRRILPKTRRSSCMTYPQCEDGEVCSLSEVVKLLPRDHFPFPSTFVDKLSSGDAVVDVGKGYSCRARS